MFNEITLETYNAQLDCLLALQDNLMKEYYMEMYFLEQENPQQSGDNVEGKSGTTTVTTDKSTAESNAKDGSSFYRCRCSLRITRFFISEMLIWLRYTVFHMQ